MTKNGNGIEDVIARMDHRADVRQAEADRIAEVRARGFVPADVGTRTIEAPARGPVRMFEGMKLYPDGSDGFASKPSGYNGWKTLQCADAFDVMRAKSRGHGGAEQFTAAQVQMGRFYGELFRKHQAAGVKCSSLEGGAAGGGRGGEFMDAVLRDRRRLDLLQARIGAGASMQVRRVRPSSRGTRVTILDRRLVDAVCIEEQTLSDVLRAHGWAAPGRSAQAKHLKALGKALAEALERMMGPVRGRGLRAAHFGDGPGSIWGNG
ncbi:hypothetical protein [Roseovarius sp. MMSF_3350]|uniref:hypothetical protein n=1 Tax=Roseovarius sp. MMSF_3350 TaxID=3046706 RepID=UPI0027401307|nr:hypothetical protein [Roseovarius sp. MMSF_3350]